MRLLLPTAAVVVGLTNALLFNALGDSPWGGPFVWKIRPGPKFTAHMLSAVLAGLIVSGALLLFAHRKLREGFFARCVLMAAAISAGGTILSVFLHFSTILLDERVPTPQGLEVLFHIALPTLAGGILGISEGVYLALPLAWLLGLFGSRTAGRTVGR